MRSSILRPNACHVTVRLFIFLVISSRTDGFAPRKGWNKLTHSCNVIGSVPETVRSEIKLDEWYTKYTTAYNLPIVASKNVSDGAVKRACYVVRFLFADNPGAAYHYYNRKGKFAVVAKNEELTWLPEYRWMNESWNRRARGFGPTLSMPISTAAEENLLCQTPDAWHKEDIGLHEFSHGLEVLGLSLFNDTFQTALKQYYREQVVERKLWNATYAAKSYMEYWAEGLQTYFEDEAPPSAGIHNHVITRQQLREYDNKLYKLIGDTFFCKNVYVKRCDDLDQEKISEAVLFGAIDSRRKCHNLSDYSLMTW
ncbi:Uncharacterised protein g10580 [Pycnogonum litorale]